MFTKAKNFILDILFPHKCVCGKWDTLLCDRCYQLITFKSTQVCPICRKISELGTVCQNCRRKTGLTGVMVFGEHSGILKMLIWNYKYGLIKDLSIPLAELLMRKFGNFLKRKNFLISYVPISKKRLNWRGFNQSELMAKRIATNLNLPTEPLFQRIGGKPQVGLSREKRLNNLRGRIRLRQGATLPHKKIVIVDDVYTSGATLEECARILRENGCREVYGLVLTRD